MDAGDRGELRGDGFLSGMTLYENTTTIAADYTISSNANAMNAGPVTVADGVTVTVPVGSVWTVV